MKAASITHMLVAAIVGALYGWIALNFWGYYSGNNAIAGWLIATLAEQGHPTLFQISISVHDILVNLILAAPFASVLVALRRLNHWRFVLISALVGLVVHNWGTEWSLQLASSPGFWLGIGMALFSLPVAFAGIRALRQG
jgi:hypothetical protein